MKKKLQLLTAFCVIALNTTLLAQDWKIGGNSLDTAFSMGSKNKKNVTFITNSVVRGLITKDGLWGFNTNSPTAQVHITGNDSAVNPFRVDFFGSNALLINNQRRVGMGASFLTARLHINSALGEDALRVQVNGTTKLLVDNAGGVSVGSLTPASDNSLYVFGSIGIGFPDPTEKLDVSGNIRATGKISADTLNIAGSSLFEGNILSHGNILTTGSFTASGDIDAHGHLRLGSAEQLTDGGTNTIASNSKLVPLNDNSGVTGLGTSSKRWFDVWAVDGTINTSDARDKTNIRDLDYGLKQIMQLHSVRFNWKNNDEKNDKLGLIAQEIQKVMPEVVRDWEFVTNEQTGKTEKVPSQRLGVMYADIIPVLITSIQQQQKIITTLEERITKMEASQTTISSNKSSSNNTNGATLEQNQPNPFNQNTTIRYHLPTGTTGQVIIYDNAGRALKTMQATQNGQVQINAYDLKAGTYTYTLMVNGKLVDSKKMVVSQ